VVFARERKEDCLVAWSGDAISYVMESTLAAINIEADLFGYIKLDGDRDECDFKPDRLSLMPHS
jgi:hypothetical protein